MHHPKLRRALRRASFCLCGAALAAAFPAGAQAAVPSPVQPPAAAPAAPRLMQSALPFRTELEHINVTVHADHSFSEQIERRFKLVSLAGVQFARRVRVAPTDAFLPGMIHPLGGGKVVEAYTLKPDGKRIPAVVQRTSPMPPAVKAALMKRYHNLREDTAPRLSFPQAAVGDVLVITYQGDYPPMKDLGDAFVLDEALPRLLPMDDGEISLHAPATMKLRFRLSNISPVQPTVSGGMHDWTWKFSNPKPVAFVPGMSPEKTFATVHVTSFPSDEAEADFMDQRNARLMAKSMPGGKFGCSYAGMAKDGPGGMQAMEMMLAGAYLRTPIAFEQMVDGINAPDCVFDDGRAKIIALNHAYDTAFSQQGWDQAYDYIRTLKRRFPHHGFVALAEARYWVQYAWEARGGGYAGSVTQEGWKLFAQRLAKAEKVLLDSRSYSAKYPHWYTDMVLVEHLLDRPAHDQAIVLEEGLKRDPSYLPMYTGMLMFMLPKWDGNWDAVDRFVNWSADATKKNEGDTMYARLYWYTFEAQPPDESLFRDTRASWPRMNRSFRELVARYPQSAWNLNNYAHFACLAGDKATYRKLRRKIGKNVVDDAWGTAPTLDVCRAKFGM